MSIDFQSKVAWSFSMAGLISGKLDVVVVDNDGVNRTKYENAWLLQKEMQIAIQGLRDVDGPVQKNITEGVI